jgi:DNA-binding MarR family transcriptional regulator
MLEITQELASADVARFTQRYPEIDGPAIEANLELAYTYGALMAAFSRCLMPFGVDSRTTRGHSKVLRLLHLSEAERLPQHEIGRKLGVTPANVTYLIVGMEKDGLIQRVGNPDDRRVTFIELTAKGRELAARVVPAVAEFMTTTCQDFTDEEKTLFIDMLTRLRKRSEISYRE